MKRNRFPPYLECEEQEIELSRHEVIMRASSHRLSDILDLDEIEDLTKIFSLNLSNNSLKLIKIVAKNQDFSYQTLIEMWLSES